MDKMLRILAVVCLVTALGSSAEASRKKKEPPKPKGNVIASVSPEAITYTQNHVTKTVAITSFTEILFKGQRATLADLQPGMTVSVTLASDPAKAARINASDPPPVEGKK